MLRDLISEKMSPKLEHLSRHTVKVMLPHAWHLNQFWKIGTVCVGGY
jgi:hypothetical protein